MRDYPNRFEGKPEAKATLDPRQIPNKGELSFPEKHPADPTKDPLTCQMTHRGGLASPRTELY